MAHYATLIVLPHGLNADYSGFPATDRLLDPAALLAAAGVALLGAAALAAAWQRRGWAAPALWFFVTLAPVLQIVPHHDFMAEHFLYLPLVGLALGAGAAIERIAGARGLSWTRALAAALLVVFAARTVRRNRDWKDPLTFWRTTAEDSLWPCARAWAGLGITLRKQGDRAEAESALRETGKVTERKVTGHWRWPKEALEIFKQPPVELPQRTKYLLVVLGVTIMVSLVLWFLSWE